jgi:hypothetical protein
VPLNDGRSLNPEDLLSELAKRQFVRQQGFADVPLATCGYQYSALMFQPRLLVGVVLLGILLQSATIFLVLAVLYRLLRGETSFANRTLPWSRVEWVTRSEAT